MEDLTTFVRRAQPEVWRFCASLAGRDHADDLTQETFARALRALPSFRGESSTRTWLLAIARRVVADHVRAEQRRRRRVARLRAQPDVDRASPGPGGVHAVAELVRGLDDDRRDAFVLTQVLGLTYAEAADVCGCEIGTIRSRVARGRRELLDGLALAVAEEQDHH